MDSTNQLPQTPDGLQAYLDNRDRQRAEDAERKEQARQALLAAWNTAKQSVANPDGWRGYADEFRQLAEQEKQESTQNRLIASGDWVDGWQRLAGDRLLAQRFEEIAARAGREFNYPQGYKPSDFWQVCVFFYLKETGGTKMFTGADDSSCGALTAPLRSSEELCLWLAAQYLFATQDASNSVLKWQPQPAWNPDRYQIVASYKLECVAAGKPEPTLASIYKPHDKTDFYAWLKGEKRDTVRQTVVRRCTKEKPHLQ